MKIVLAFLALLTAFTAHADIPPIEKGGDAYQIALRASNIFRVFNFRVQGMQYKLVEMDTNRNGDLTTTMVLLVGESVGGDAGFEAAFLLGPSEERHQLKSARAARKSLKLVFADINGGESTVYVAYDAKKKNLVELDREQP